MIRACVKENVFRLVYTSTLHVALDKSWDDVWKAVETRPYPHTNIFEGYGGSKKRAEQLVLAANGTPLNSGENLPLCAESAAGVCLYILEPRTRS